ncbi:MAG TPA: zinc-ribbon domain-containing protein [Rhodopila sp.]|jgi:predicted Zn finger-like uncharacterized protein|nr:zinc-ribbon domain-containing protein [Rhodopila sp.]
MRITCPSCGTGYDVPETRLTPHKLVRCVRCKSEWVPAHPEQDAEPAPAEQAPFEAHIDPLPPVTAMDRLAASPAAAPSSPGLLAAWVLTLVLLVGMLAATVTWRSTIIRVWPQSALILAPFGQAEPPPAQTAGKTTG